MVDPWMGLPVVLCALFAGIAAMQAARYELAARRKRK